MVRHFLFVVFFSLLANQAFAVAFEASVDRANIGEGESLTLTLRYNSNVFSGDPDLSPLQQQFTIINQQRKNSFQYIDGKSESWTVWTVTLTPKRKGSLILPSIEYKGERTKPIQINVNKLDPSLKNQQKDVFFHTQTDIKTSYVQGQIVYSEKLYFSVPLDNSQLNEVEVEDAVVQALGETKQYRTQLNGRNFDVYERRYVIFPQTSGDLIIPGPRYSGEISNGRWRPGRPISVSHRPIRIQVLPQPASYPQADTWLPAKNVSLDYKWLGDVSNLNQGEPITLSLTLKAQGLGAAQLPKFELMDIPNLKYYPEQAQSQDMSDDNGITGTVTQNIAIVATQSGEIRLPEIRIPWFDITAGRIEYAVMPAQTLMVSGAPKTPTTNQTQALNAASSDALSNDNQPTANAMNMTQDTASAKFWPVLSLIFMTLWLITSYLLWRKHQPQQQDTEPDTQSHTISSHLKDIKKACRNNDAKAAQGFDQSIGLAQLTVLSDSAEFKQALQELDYTLYSANGNSAWQGEYLWQLIRAIKPSRSQEPSPLQPLYPN